MNSVSINKQCDELESYEEIAEYTKKVLDNFDGVDNLDGNDIYNIFYVKKLCENKLSEDIENSAVKQSLDDTLTRVTLITQLLNKENISEAVNRDIDKNKINKVNKSKHAKSNKIDNLEDKKKPIYRGAMQGYLVKILPKALIMILSLLACLMASDLSEMITNVLPGNSSAAQSGSLASVTNILGSLISFISMVILITSSIGIAMDILYISVPSFRYMVDNKNKKEDTQFISNDAVDAVKYENVAVGYEMIDNTNKIEASRVLLETLVDKLSVNNGSDNKHLNELGKLLNIIDDKKSSITEKIESLVDAELYYSNNKTDLEKYLKEA